MAMDRDQLIERAKRRLGAGEGQPRVWPTNELALAAAIDAALHELSTAVARDDNQRYLLQQWYAVTTDGNGIADLLAAVGETTGDADILTEGVFLGDVRDQDGNALWRILHYADFRRSQERFRALYCLVGRKLYTSASGSADETITPLASNNLRVLANFTPQDLTYLPAELEDDLVGQLAEVVTRKLPKAA